MLILVIFYNYFNFYKVCRNVWASKVVLVVCWFFMPDFGNLCIILLFSLRSLAKVLSFLLILLMNQLSLFNVFCCFSAFCLIGICSGLYYSLLSECYTCSFLFWFDF